MEMINPFVGDAFSMASLTDAINILPNNYGLLEKIGLFPVRGVATRTIMIEMKNGVLNLIQSRPVGDPGDVSGHGKRNVRSFVIPYIPLQDKILPNEYSGLRAFGSEDQLTPFVSIFNDKMQENKNKFAITLEYLRMGALKGIILDADLTPIYNLYTEFGITQKSISFALGNDATKVRAKCLSVSRHIEKNLKGEVKTGIKVLCSNEFMDALVDHPLVKEAFMNYGEAADRLGGDPRQDFKFGGLSFSEYVGEAPDAAGNTRRFIAAGEAHAYPTGTMNTFNTVVAPGEFSDTVNTIGKLLYARQEPRKFNQGVDIHMESSPLPMCKRPEVLVKLTVA